MGGSSLQFCFSSMLCQLFLAHSHIQTQPVAPHMAKNGCCACRNTYTALNALAGHFNSFGTTAPLPKKRLERINKELDDATKMLGRGR